MISKTWQKPLVVSLTNKTIKTGGTGTAYIEYIAVTSGGICQYNDQFASFPGNTGIIEADACGSTSGAINAGCDITASPFAACAS